MPKSNKSGGLFGKKIQLKLATSASRLTRGSGQAAAPPPGRALPPSATPPAPEIPPAPPAPAPPPPALPSPSAATPRSEPEVSPPPPPSSTEPPHVDGETNNGKVEQPRNIESTIQNKVELNSESLTPPHVDGETDNGKVEQPRNIESTIQNKVELNSESLTVPHADGATANGKVEQPRNIESTIQNEVELSSEEPSLIEQVSVRHYDDWSCCEEYERPEISSKHQDSNYGSHWEASTSLNYLAGKRTYPSPPSLPRTVGPQEPKRQCCRFAPRIKCTLKQYADENELTKNVEIPGTSRDCRVSMVARMTTRLLLRRSVKSIYKFHRSGKCLEGSFTLVNFLVDEDMLVHLDCEETSLKDHSKEGARQDFKQFARSVQSQMFPSGEIPKEISDWLSLIERDASGYEYLISYHSCLMEHHQTLNTFMDLYRKLLLMQKSDPDGYRFVLGEMNKFDGWEPEDLHNGYVRGTYYRRDPATGKMAEYHNDVMSLFRLIRNTFEHITLKTLDGNNNISFGPEEFEYILHDQFPGLLSDFMEAMYVASYMWELNLESRMP